MGNSSSPLVVDKLFTRFRVFFAAGLLLASNLAYSAVAENITTLNPKAFALGNAVSADYVGIDSVQYNPAALVNLRPGFSTEFRLVGAPYSQIIRRTSPALTPKYPEFNLFYRGYTVRCDSAYKPFSGLGIPSSISSNPGRDPVSGGLDPNIPTLNYELPGDICFGPELTNPNGIFLDDQLAGGPATDLDRAFTIPAAAPFYLPNIGYKPSADSRVAFAAQVFSQAPLPILDFQGDVALVNNLGIQRFTFSPAMAFQVTDRLSVGAAMRIVKSRLQVSVYLDGQSMLFGFLNAFVHDLCKTNETRRSDELIDGGSEFIYDQLLNCVELYQIHQERVDEGLARDSGYWPFLPWETIGDVYLEGDNDTIYGWMFGVQWQPMPWLKWGGTYRTKEDDLYHTSGKVYYKPGVTALFKGLNSTPVVGAITNLLLDGSPSDRLTVDISVPWPAAYSSGVSMQVLPNTKINVEYRKYEYSVWKNWNATITSAEVNAIAFLGLLTPGDTVGNTIPIPAGGIDTSYWAYGLEQQWNKRLAFRFGYEDRPFLSDGGFFPVNKIKMVSVGGEYKLTHDKTVDVALTSLYMDAQGGNSRGSSLAEDPLAFLTIRGGEYINYQTDVHAILFTANYTHRF